MLFTRLCQIGNPISCHFGLSSCKWIWIKYLLVEYGAFSGFPASGHLLRSLFIYVGYVAMWRLFLVILTDFQLCPWQLFSFHYKHHWSSFYLRTFPPHSSFHLWSQRKTFTLALNIVKTLRNTLFQLKNFKTTSWLCTNFLVSYVS